MRYQSSWGVYCKSYSCKNVVVLFEAWWRDKGVNTFTKGISLKVSLITRQEFEFANSNVRVQHISHYTIIIIIIILELFIRNNFVDPGKDTEVNKDSRKNWNCSNHRTVEIDKNTEMSPEELRRLAVTQISMKITSYLRCEKLVKR